MKKPVGEVNGGKIKPIDDVEVWVAPEDKVPLPCTLSNAEVNPIPDEEAEGPCDNPFGIYGTAKGASPAKAN
jgi:hypothetical protein